MTVINYHHHLVTGLFLPVLLLNQRWSPPLTLQASHCSTFRIMCDVPSIAVFCSESIEWFPGTASKFFLKLLVTNPVAAIITGIIVHFRFHILLLLPLLSLLPLLFFCFFFFCLFLLLLLFCFFFFFLLRVVVLPLSSVRLAKIQTDVLWNAQLEVSR